MKTAQFLLISLAEEEVRLIADADTRGLHLSADIIGDSIVAGAEKVGVAKIYIGRGKKLERTGGASFGKPRSSQPAPW